VWVTHVVQVVYTRIATRLPKWESKGREGPWGVGVMFN